MYRCDKINAASFEKEAKKAGIGSKIAMAHLFDTADRFIKSLKKARQELEKVGFVNSADICEKIIEQRSFTIQSL